jgi:hypothetical protein
MLPKVLAIAALTGVCAIAAIALLVFFAMRPPRELRDRKLDQLVVTTPDDVASISLPPTFKFAGFVNSGTRKRFGGGTTSLEYHLDEERLSLRFEQGQYTTAGGHSANPVTLIVTLFNNKLPKSEIADVRTTPIVEFYSPTDDRSLSALTLMNADSTLRSAEVTDAFAPGTARWLVVFVDADRRVRVDFFAMTKYYTLAEAHKLVRDVAAGVSALPPLQTHFDSIATFDARALARRDAAIATIASGLVPCGISSMTPGPVVFGGDCAARLSEDSRYLAVAFYLGKVPLSAATVRPNEKPAYTFAFTDKDFSTSSTTGGRPNLEIRMFYWSDSKQSWAVDGLQSFLDNDSDSVTFAVLADLAKRGSEARSDVFLWDLAGFDVEFHPDEANLSPIIARAESYRKGLAEGRIISGVRAIVGRFR